MNVKISSWITHSYDKLRSDSEAGVNKKYTVYMAKGETEGCQIAFRPEGDTTVSLKLVSGDSSLLYGMSSLANKHLIEGKYYTDSTPPYNGEEIELKAGETTPILVEFRTTENTESGDHKLVFEAICDGTVIGKYEVTVHVWSFALPVGKTLQTAVGLRRWRIESLHGYCDDELYKKYYDMLLDHGISAYVLPYDILDPRADAYMSDPRVTAFSVLWEVDDDKLLQYYNKIVSNPEWTKKAFFYPLDEPDDIEKLEELKKRCERLIELCPKIGRTSPYYTDIQIGENSDQVDHMSEYINLHCPKLALYDDEMSYGQYLNYKPEKTFWQRMDDLIARGDRMWTYVCNAPIKPYGALFADYSGICQRSMFWQTYERSATGFLYWCCNAWDYHGHKINPWEDLWNSCKGLNPGEEPVPVYGEGILCYPGMKVGIDGPVSSIRMKIFRDGIEDYELFVLAEKLLGRDYVIGKINEVTPSLTEFTSDMDKIALVRKEIGEAIEKAR